MTSPRVIRIPVRPGLALEGRLTERGAHAAIVAPPHPLYGGSIGNPVVRTLEAALGSSGFTTLAFNYRGIGDSDGEPSGELEDACADTAAAVAALGGHTLSWACGYSFGAICALTSASERAAVDCLLVAPPAAMLSPEVSAKHAGRKLVLVGDQDEYAPLSWLREGFGEAPFALTVLPGVDHYFLGSGVRKLAEKLGETAL